MENISRQNFALIVWSVTLIIFVFVGTLIVGLYGTAIGIGVCGVVVAFTFKHFIVSVPEVTILLTINLVNGKLKEYNSGLHFKYPWEQIKNKNYLVMEMVSKSHQEDFAARDGPNVNVKWSYRYKPNKGMMKTYLETSDSVIDTGIQDIVSGFLSAIIAKMDAVDAREKITEIQKKIKNSFEKTGRYKKTIEKSYGIDFLELSIADVEYEDRVQKARATGHIAQTLKATAKTIQGRNKNSDITDKEAYNTALVIDGKIEKKEISITTDVKGEGGNALAAIFIAGAQAAGGNKNSK